MKTDTIHFNIEMLSGEIGAFIGAPLFAHFAALFRDTPHFISFFGVVGALTASLIFFLTMKVRNVKKRGEYSNGKIISDLLHFAPASILVAFLVYQPILFILSSHFLEKGFDIFHAVVVSQIAAFLAFAILMNIYRFILEKTLGKRL